jgi:hypothetical protein
MNVVGLGSRAASDWVKAHEELSSLAQRRAALDWEEGTALLQALRSEAHRHLGFGTFAEYVERLFGYGPRATEEKLRVATALEGLPEMDRDLRVGKLNWSAALARSLASRRLKPSAPGSRLPEAKPCARSKRWFREESPAIALKLILIRRNGPTSWPEGIFLRAELGEAPLRSARLADRGGFLCERYGYPSIPAEPCPACRAPHRVAMPEEPSRFELVGDTIVEATRFMSPAETSRSLEHLLGLSLLVGVRSGAPAAAPARHRFSTDLGRGTLMINIADPVEVLARNLADWDVPHVEKAIFDTTEPDAIVDAVDGFCRQHLGSPIAGYLFQSTSVGSTHGIRLDDRRDLVLKARPPVADNPHLHMDAPPLSTVLRVMSWLHREGYPCPEPIAGPLPLGRGLQRWKGIWIAVLQGTPSNPIAAEPSLAATLICSAVSSTSRSRRPRSDTSGAGNRCTRNRTASSSTSASPLHSLAESTMSLVRRGASRRMTDITCSGMATGESSTCFSKTAASSPPSTGTPSAPAPKRTYWALLLTASRRTGRSRTRHAYQTWRTSWLSWPTTRTHEGEASRSWNAVPCWLGVSTASRMRSLYRLA